MRLPALTHHTIENKYPLDLIAIVMTVFTCFKGNKKCPIPNLSTGWDVSPLISMEVTALYGTIYHLIQRRCFIEISVSMSFRPIRGKDDDGRGDEV